MEPDRAIGNFSLKRKPSRLPDSNFIFFVATKKSSKRKLGAALCMSCA